MDENTPCVSLKDLEGRFGQSCRVAGVCEVRPFHNPKRVLIAEWPGVRLEDGGFVLMESFWQKDRVPDVEGLKRWNGRPIEVTGVLHGAPPGGIQNLSIPCLSPITDIRELPAPAKSALPKAG